MGGRVVLAVNIAAFPEELPTDVIAAIFAAASATVLEAGGTIAGGHTIRNPEPIFGLAVQGVVDPKHIFRKSGAQAGDIAILSKPLGTGLVTAAGTEADKKVAIAGMRTLNRAAAEQLRAHQDHVHAVTDVTGYGLAGHGWEIAERSGVTLVVDSSALPLYPGALDIAKSGHRTGGDPRNRLYVGDHLTATADDAHIALCMDPQTSGGLLAAVPQATADVLVSSGAWTAVGHFASGGPALEIR
jgi:selenide,water dikinase